MRKFKCANTLRRRIPRTLPARPPRDTHGNERAWRDGKTCARKFDVLPRGDVRAQRRTHNRHVTGPRSRAACAPFCRARITRAPRAENRCALMLQKPSADSLAGAARDRVPCGAARDRAKKPLDGGELYLQRISKWLRLCADGVSQNSPKHEVPCEGRDFRRMRETSGDLFRRACAGDRMSMSSLSRFRGDVPVQFRPQPGCRQGRRPQR